ncbi:MCE family protein [Nocardia terpenica]|uniref:MCE family protein n=1 Tax=Nocardia terpenica TaxID=455432 RepID=UPI0018E09136
MAANKLVEKDGAGRIFGAGAKVKLAGLALVLSLAAIVAVALTMFAGGFTTTEAVYIDAPRAGLVLDRDAKVKMRGVEIGKVTSISYTGSGARLALAIKPDELALVPTNAGVDIGSTTVFGAKYVNFTVPQRPSGQALRPGAVLRAQQVTVEFNTLFQHLSDVLGKIAPEKLNATLTALGGALQGRGDELGKLLSDSDTYLRDLNPSLPDLQRDLRSATGVTNLYADATPDLLRTTGNAAVTSDTLVARQGNLDGVLANLIGLADTSGAVLRDNQQQLVTALDLLRPTATLLNEYSPALFCLVSGAANALPRGNEIFGGKGPYVTLNASFMPGGTPYQYPQDLPKVNATGGPHCEGILDRVPNSHSNYMVTDTSQGEVWTPSLTTHLNGPRVFQLLFAGLPGVPAP